MTYAERFPVGSYQGSAAGEVQRAEFAVPCDMRKSHVALAGLNN